MKDDGLTAFQASQLNFLRSQVDRAQDERYRRDSANDSEVKLFQAQRELTEFTKNLRSAGKNI
jgi:hypothetical protein